MNLRIDLSCGICQRSKICTEYVPEKVENLHIYCKSCEDEIIVFLSLVRMYGRMYVDKNKLHVRVDKL